MIRLALELPTSQLARWAPKLDLDFVLAHKVLDDTNYADFFRLRNDERELILDNSTHEFGRPLSFDLLQRAADLVNADWVVAPDIVNAFITDKQVEQNVDWADLSHETLNRPIGFVLCGNTIEQLGVYLDKMAQKDNMSMPCFTFHEPKRLEWWEYCQDHETFGIWQRFHLLGMDTLDELKKWVDISEDFPEYNFSFDTSKPLKFGVQGLRLSQQEVLRGGRIRSKEVLELKELTPEQIECCEENIDWLKKVCRGES